MTTQVSPHTPLADSAPSYAGPCLLLTLDGTPLGRGRLEPGDKWSRLRAVTPSGALASAFFGQGQRHFLLAFPDGTTVPVLVYDCRWHEGERFCALMPALDAAA